VRRGATDPVCGMTVDRDRALRAHGQYFCSEDCRARYVPETTPPREPLGNLRAHQH
jgi:hypothetical protein